MVAQDDPRLANVGFAKLVGSGVELYAKKHEITMGRLSKSCDVDVVLGECHLFTLLLWIDLVSRADAHLLSWENPSYFPPDPD